MLLRLAFYTLLLSPVHLSNAQGLCLSPAEPEDFKIDKQLEPELYEFVRSEYQTYLEDMEVYLRCLEQDRAASIKRLSEINKQFKRNFGKDAVFVYDAQ